MIFSITRRYRFEAAHRLLLVPVGHKCRNMHGHSYKVDVTVGGVRHLNDGMLIDFFVLDDIVNPIIAGVDHRTLNDIIGLENPTAENIAAWFYDEFMKNVVGRFDSTLRIRVYETDDCWADVEHG